MTARLLFRLAGCTLLLSLSPSLFPAVRKPAPKTKKPPAAKDGPVSTNPQVMAWLKSLSDRDKVAQLMIMPCYGDMPNTKSRQWRLYTKWVRDLHAGGLIVLNRVRNGQVVNAEPYAMAIFFNRMQKLSRLPLIVGGDFERGASMRVAGTTKFPHNMAYGAARDLEGSKRLGATTARESRALGVHWIFAPDADVNNNPANPIINLRSYGSDPQDVAAHVGAYIDGAHSAAQVLVTAKHFPGHGDSAVDSHLGMPRLEATKERLNTLELVPFRAAIAHNVDSIMTAHMSVPALEPEEIPATVSPAVLTGLLRNEMKFSGIITTDAMDMAGLNKAFGPGEASVRALEAGADILLMPPKPEETLRAVTEAIRTGRLTRRHIDLSVAKILEAKVRLGLHKSRLIDPEKIADVLEAPESEEEAQRVADRAVTLVRDPKGMLPLQPAQANCLFVLNDSRGSTQGRRLVEEVKRRAPAMTIQMLDALTPEIELTQASQDSAKCAAIVLATFVSPRDGKGSVALPGNLGDFVNLLTNPSGDEKPKPLVALVSMGNPYLLQNFPNVGAYLATFSTVPVSEVAAAKALFGEIPITGHLPVTIPGFAAYGDGLQRAASQAAH